MLRGGARLVRTLSSAPSSDLTLSRSSCGLWATLTLNREDVHNALTPGIIDGFYEHLANLQKGDLPRAVFLRAAGGKTFCAGGDLKQMRDMGGKTREQNMEDAMKLSGVFAGLRRFPRPTIALINGPCFGGGVGIIASCDMAFAVPDAKFALSEVLLGVIPATISPFVLDRMGASASSRYMLTAERFDAREAKRIGLIHDVVDDLDALEAHLRASLSKCSPDALTATKSLIANVTHRPLNDETRQYTAARLADVRESADGQEGMSAFIEKRKPNWFPK
jgi:methylglutaconyl-CoA hydratase